MQDECEHSVVPQNKEALKNDGDTLKEHRGQFKRAPLTNLGLRSKLTMTIINYNPLNKI